MVEAKQEPTKLTVIIEVGAVVQNCFGPKKNRFGPKKNFSSLQI
jgi:hypothetical protein